MAGQTIGTKVFAEKKNSFGEITETISGIYIGYDGEGSDKIEQADGKIRYVDNWLTKTEQEYNEIIAKRNAPKTVIKMIKCACGHTVPMSQVMSSTRGACCPDCYDRMSD
jgi:hypothetical protein